MQMPTHKEVRDRFLHEVNASGLSVLELGSKRNVFGAPLKRAWFPNAREYVGLDIHPGEGVDVVGDVHELSSIFGPSRFDAVHSGSVLEHLPFPWVAAVEIIKTLKLGGVMFHNMPANWPLHELPADFWRSTSETFKVLFPRALGIEIEEIGVDYPMHHHMVDPPPGQEEFHTHLNYGFYGARMRKVREVNLDGFSWPLTPTDILGEHSYPAH